MAQFLFNAICLGIMHWQLKKKIQHADAPEGAKGAAAAGAQAPVFQWGVRNWEGWGAQDQVIQVLSNLHLRVEVSGGPCWEDMRVVGACAACASPCRALRRKDMERIADVTKNLAHHYGMFFLPCLAQACKVYINIIPFNLTGGDVPLTWWCFHCP